MKVVVYLNFILTLLLIGGFAWIVAFPKKPEQVVNNKVIEGSNNISYIDRCGDECKKQIEEIISNNKQEIVNTVVITPAPVATVKAKAQTAYIPINGPISTTSMDWQDAYGTEFYLDYNTDYGKTAYANWQAFLKVADGNGTAFARLYDVTNKIAVNGSEVQVSNNGELTQSISGALSFWSGNNQYRVQIKSLNGYATTFGSGRIKIIY